MDAVKCTLCGHLFIPAETTCGSCPMVGHACGYRCPRCGFQVPGRSVILDWVRRIRDRIRHRRVA